MIEGAFRKLDELSKVDVVNLLNIIFEDYALRMQWNLESFDRDVHENSISLSDSFVMDMKDEPVGIVLLSFRDKRARIDLMGVIPSFRRSGVGFQMVDEAVKICKWRGSDSVVLEVLKKDSRAMGFYRKFGFREKRDLVTFFLRKCGNNGYVLKRTTPDVVMEKALCTMGKYGRQPEWQREPSNFSRLDLYNFDRIVDESEREIRYCVWGQKEDVMYVVDSGPSERSDFHEVLQAVCGIAKGNGYLLLFPTVPEEDALFKAAEKLEPEILLVQTEMIYKLH